MCDELKKLYEEYKEAGEPKQHQRAFAELFDLEGLDLTEISD